MRQEINATAQEKLISQAPASEPASLADCGFLRLPGILELVPVKKSTLWAWVKEGRFVAPVHLGPRTTVWRVQDVRRWLLSQGNDRPS